MDKTARIILGFAIAILYPVLIFMSVTQIVPKISIDEPKYPVYPTNSDCGQRTTVYSYNNYDSAGRATDSNNSRYDSCVKRHRDQYDRDNEAYTKANSEYRDAKDRYEITRLLVMMVIALASIVVGYFIRSVKELAGGLVVGSTVIIAGSTVTLITLAWDSNLKIITNILIILGFIVTTVLIWVVDNNMSKTIVPLNKDIEPPKAPQQETKLLENPEELKRVTTDQDKSDVQPLAVSTTSIETDQHSHQNHDHEYQADVVNKPNNYAPEEQVNTKE